MYNTCIWQLPENTTLSKACDDIFPSDKIVNTLVSSNFVFRKEDGTGSNTFNPTYGNPGQPLLRLSPNQYKDGKDVPVDDRPNPRTISNNIFNQPTSIPSSMNISNMFWLYGQLIDHDITLVEEAEPKEPFNIPIPPGDPFFKTITEFKFNRSNHTASTATQPRHQINSLSPLLDASSIYGIGDRQKALRRFKKGLLRFSVGKHLPFDDGKIDNAGTRLYASYLAGDVRSNEHIALAFMHTIWMREHNNWASIIHENHSYLNDEQIFQLAKVMVEAELQHITYNEFLPTLGANLPPYQGFNPNINPQISQEFNFMYRIGHTLISSDALFNRYGLKLTDTFFSSFLLQNELTLEGIAKSFSTTLAEESDVKIIDDLRNRMFKGTMVPLGLDLAALSIQRERDHGVGNFNFVRTHLGLNPYSNFSQISNDQNVNIALSTTYKSLDKMDMFVGLMAERKIFRLLGETQFRIACDQFQRIRDGDPFWHENRLHGRLLDWVKSNTLGHIILRNTNLKEINKYVMRI